MGAEKAPAVQNGDDTIEGALEKVTAGVTAQKDLNTAANAANATDASFSGTPQEAGMWTTFDSASATAWAVALVVLGFVGYRAWRARGA